MDTISTIEALQDRVEILEGVMGLRVDYDPAKVKALRLQPQHFRILRLLLGTRLATYQYLITALYGDDPTGGPDNPDNTIKVQVTRMRKHLAPMGVKVETLWGEGYFIDDKSKAVARRLLGIGEAA